MLKRYSDGTGLLSRIDIPIDWDRTDLNLTELATVAYPNYLNWLQSKINPLISLRALPPDFYFSGDVIPNITTDHTLSRLESLQSAIFIPHSTLLSIQSSHTRFPLKDSIYPFSLNVHADSDGDNDGNMTAVIIKTEVDQLAILYSKPDSTYRLMKITVVGQELEYFMTPVDFVFQPGRVYSISTDNFLTTTDLCFQKVQGFYPEEFPAATQAFQAEIKLNFYYLLDKFVSERYETTILQTPTNKLDRILYDLVTAETTRKRLGGNFVQFTTDFTSFSPFTLNMHALPAQSNYMKLVYHASKQVPVNVVSATTIETEATLPPVQTITDFRNTTISTLAYTTQDTISVDVAVYNENDNHIACEIKVYSKAKYHSGFRVNYLCNPNMGITTEPLLASLSKETKLLQPMVITGTTSTTVTYEHQTTKEIVFATYYEKRLIPTAPFPDMVFIFYDQIIRIAINDRAQVKEITATGQHFQIPKAGPTTMTDMRALSKVSVILASSPTTLTETTTENEIQIMTFLRYQEYRNLQFDSEIEKISFRLDVIESATKPSVLGFITTPLQLASNFNLPAKMAIALSTTLLVLNAVEESLRGNYLESFFIGLSGFLIGLHNARTLGKPQANAALKRDLIDDFRIYSDAKATMQINYRGKKIPVPKDFPGGLMKDYLEIRSNKIQQLPGTGLIAEALNKQPDGAITQYLKKRFLIPEHHYLQATTTNHIPGVGTVTFGLRLGISDGVNSARGDLNIGSSASNTGKLPSQPGILFFPSVHTDGKLLPYEHPDKLTQFKAILAQNGADRSKLLVIDNLTALEQRYKTTYAQELKNFQARFENSDSQIVERLEHTIFPREFSYIVNHFTSEDFKKNWGYNVTSRNCQGYASEAIKQLQGLKTQGTFIPKEYIRSLDGFINITSKNEFDAMLKSIYHDIIGFAPKYIYKPRSKFIVRNHDHSTV